MIGLIVARSKNNVIGKNGNIPWKIKGEQKQFRELTTGNVVIMGRKSYEEIGHPLPNRMNIVVSTTTEYQGDNLVSVKSLEDALLLAKPILWSMSTTILRRIVWQQKNVMEIQWKNGNSLNWA